jgi:hypothetical protein
MFCCLPLIVLPFAALLTAFWIWMVIEVATKEPAEDQDKIMWLLIVLLCGGIGAAIYFFVRRPERIRKYGR